MEREEAINVIRKNYPHVSSSGSEFETALRALIPELAESEDERIRKVIYKLMLGMREEIFTSQDEIVTKEKVLAYLEKPQLKEQKPAEWSEEDEEMRLEAIRVLVSGCERYRKESGCLPSWHKVISWLKNLPERFNLQPKNEWSKEEKYRIESIKTLVTTGKFADINTIKTIWELLDSIHPQPSWKPSEQEKGALRTAIHVLTEERNFPKAAAQLQNILDAFEGKESRKDWKPSEEQMEALKCTIADVAKFSKRGGRQVELENEPYYKALHSLYCNLEKLM